MRPAGWMRLFWYLHINHRGLQRFLDTINTLSRKDERTYVGLQLSLLQMQYFLHNLDSLLFVRTAASLVGK